MANTTIKLLKDLIAIPSVNPSLVPGGSGESDISRALETYMSACGLDVTVEEAAPGRENVIGVLEGGEPGPSLMFCGHSDTVGVEGMTDPFDPVQHDEKIYGRGSGDMKGGLAAMIDAARIIAENGGWKKGKLIVAAVADEEYLSIGAEKLIKSWSADAAVVTEPTGMAIAIGHKGFSWIEIIIAGRAAHGSRPAEGLDAMLKMGRVLNRLDHLNLELQSRPPHPLLGCASLHTSFISGGREMSTYPDKCVLQMERRNLSSEPAGVALREVEEILTSLRESDPEFAGSAKLLFERPPYETPSGHSLPDKLASAMQQIGQVARREGMTYWTDAAILGQAGIPSVVFGPGGFGYHGLEEYVNADEVLLCRDALVALAREFGS
ncbi:MAG TPA: ArgE/DapE family deacylase [Pyrinomonadaceae bacterium]|nr:ArgE/DapE family deacylase [Pyrinomonadaceae bacterium]